MNVFVYNGINGDLLMEKVKNIRGYSKSRMIFTKDHKYHMNRVNVLFSWQSEMMTFYSLSPSQRQKVEKSFLMRIKGYF